MVKKTVEKSFPPPQYSASHSSHSNLLPYETEKKIICETRSSLPLGLRKHFVCKLKTVSFLAGYFVLNVRNYNFRLSVKEIHDKNGTKHSKTTNKGVLSIEYVMVLG